MARNPASVGAPVPPRSGWPQLTILPSDVSAAKAWVLAYTCPSCPGCDSAQYGCIHANRSRVRAIDVPLHEPGHSCFGLLRLFNASD
eukprot:2246078-Pleurochrysis_carterae.AAC.2